MPLSRIARERRRHARCCERKIGWKTRRLAKEAAKRTLRDSKEKLRTYKCSACGRYHCGHAPIAISTE